MKKIGIYVQVPFCQTRCTYCNFHTGLVATSRFALYVEAVCGEMRGHRKLLRAAGVGWGAEIEEKAHSQEWLCHEGVADTVYIGGGTPSLLEPVHLQNILDAIRETFGCERDGQGGRSSAAPLQESGVAPGAEGGKAPDGRDGKASASEGGRYELLEEVTLEADPETVEAGEGGGWGGGGGRRGRFWGGGGWGKGGGGAGGGRARGGGFCWG